MSLIRSVRKFFKKPPFLAALAVAGLILISVCLSGFPALAKSPGSGPGDIVALGTAIFFDTNLSTPPGQSCASCHAPEVGFTGPDSEINALGAVEPGAVPDRFGNRKPPSAAYAGDSPVFHYDEAKGGWIGGMFWDGRATGWTLGDPLAEQAMGPFLNLLEMNMPGARQVCIKVAHSDYAGLFEEVWGPGTMKQNYINKNVALTYERIAISIAAYERSTDVNPFTSKFDLFWDNAKSEGKDVTKIKFSGGMGGGGGGMGGGGMGGRGGMDPYRWQAYQGLGLSDAELQGLAAFNDPNRGDCARCHTLGSAMASRPLFSDFRYWNIGVPKNPENPFYFMPAEWNPDGMDWVDYGLGGFLKKAGEPSEIYELELGKFKTPTLRNVDLRPYPEFVKAYGHNGFFKSLEEIILFYTWRAHMAAMGGGGMGGGGMSPDPNMFPAPEVSQNLEPLNFTMMGMGQQGVMMDQANILAFLKTLSDGYFLR